MGFFDDKKSKEKIGYLEEERKKLWDRVIQLEETQKDLQKSLERKVTDDEREARQSSKKAAEYRNKAQERLDDANTILEQINGFLGLAEQHANEVGEIKNEIDAQKLNVYEIKTNVDEAHSNLLEKEVMLEEKIDQLNAFFQSYPDLSTQLNEVDSNISKIEESAGKAGASLSAVNKRKLEIDDLYHEVFGYTDTDEEGEETAVEGLKDQLEEAYSELEEKIENTSEQLGSLTEESKKNYSDFVKSHKEKYEAINKEIENLLPAAMTAGLSSAFSSKKEDEVTSSEALEKRFGQGIKWLIAVSCIPIVLSVYFLSVGVDLNEVINRLPRIVLAIIPMYVPVLWFTYSANKKLNLSKRLIEEYAHKEVLSKTYEGLSKQIAGLDNEDQSKDLKFRLLSNFLQVTSENPGKLISNYEASDHPVMEALEQSYKLQSALDKAGSIPGIGKIISILESKAKGKIEKKGEAIEDVLSDDKLLE